MAPTREVGFKILTSPPVYDSLYAECGPGTLCRVAKTCHGAHAAVDDYFRHALDFTRRMARFFGDDALDFRRLQAETHFIVSGSQALQLLDRTVYARSDLDIYAFPQNVRRIGRWLLARGYRYSSSSPDSNMFDLVMESASRRTACAQYDDSLGVRDVFDFQKPCGSAEEDHSDTVLRVQIIVADIAPVDLVLRFHSSAQSFVFSPLPLIATSAVVMNFVTWDRAYALYPDATFEHRRGLLNCTKLRSITAAQKYLDRGYTIDGHLHGLTDNTQRGLYKSGLRWVGDTHCWVVRLDTVGLDTPESPTSWELNSWALDLSKSRMLQLVPIVSRALRYRYCAAPAFFSYVCDFMREDDIQHAGQVPIFAYKEQDVAAVA